MLDDAVIMGNLITMIRAHFGRVTYSFEALEANAALLQRTQDARADPANESLGARRREAARRYLDSLLGTVDRPESEDSDADDE